MLSLNQSSFFDNGGRNKLETRISDLGFLFKANNSEKTCLDVGCAEGKILNLLKDRFKHVTGVEVSPELYRKASEQFSGVTNVTLYNKNIQSIELDSFFDVVLLLGVLHYLPGLEEREAVLDKLLGVAGLMLVRTSFVDNMKEQNPLSTPLCAIARVAKKHCAQWIFIDNSWRRKPYDLGDLVILYKNPNYTNNILELLGS